MYVSSGGDLVLAGLLVGILESLGSLGTSGSFGFVIGSLLLPQFLKSSGDLGVSLLLLLKSLGLGGNSLLLSCHLYHNNIIIQIMTI